MKLRLFRNWIVAMLMVICVCIALAAPDIALKAPFPATIGYVASIGFLFFAGYLFILIFIRKRRNN